MINATRRINLTYWAKEQEAIAQNGEVLLGKFPRVAW